jgi:cytochrome c oxidase subunit IV
MTTVDTHTEHHAAHAAHEEKPDRWYVGIGIFLAVLTAIEVALSYIKIPITGGVTALLFLIMAIKFWTVVQAFMHLKFDHKLFGYLFWSGFILAIAVYVAMLTTYQLWAK